MEDIKKNIERRRKYIIILYRFFCLEKDKETIKFEIYENIQVQLDDENVIRLKKWIDNIDEAIGFCESNLSSDWSWKRIPNIHKAILINGYFEIIDEQRPKSIVINEMLKLSQLYLEGYEYKYINSVLDKINV